MSISLHNIIKEYLNYFGWFLEGELSSEELDYMLHLRDRIEEMQGNLGDIDKVWKMQAKKMLQYPSLFNEPTSNKWWWKKTTWEKLALQKTAIIKQRQTKAVRHFVKVK